MCFKTLRAILLALFLAGTLAAAPGKRPAPHPQVRLTDSLFFAARYDTILTLLDAFVPRALQAGDSALAGRLIAQRGRVYLAQGRQAQAESAIDLAIGMSRAARDTLGWMPALNYKGFVLVGRGQYEQALPYYEKRLQLARAVRSSGDEAWAWSSIAYVHQARGETVRARDEYMRAIELFRAGGFRSQELTPLLGLGEVLGTLGDSRGQMQCYQRVWVVSREVRDPVNEMWALNSLGYMEFDHGDMGRALAYYRRAYELGLETGFARGQIQPALNLALAEAYRGRYAAAESVLVRARQVCLETGNLEFADAIEMDLANVYLARGETGRASAVFRRFAAQPGRLHAGRVEAVTVTLARIMAASGEPDSALALMEKRFGPAATGSLAESRADATLLRAEIRRDAGDNRTAAGLAKSAREQYERIGLQRSAVVARLIESDCLRRAGEPAEALRALDAALDAFTEVRAGTGAPEWRESFGRRVASDLLAAARVVLDHPGSEPRENRERAFFAVLQRFKTRTLIERIAEPRLGAGDLVNRMATTTGVDELQRDILQPGEVLLDFVAGRDESYLFAVTAGRFDVHILPGQSPETLERIRLYRDLVSSPSADYTPERLRAARQALGAEILGPVAGVIGDAERVIVSPDGAYAAIPFATLIVDTEGGAIALSDREVVITPSASFLAIIRSSPIDTRELPLKIAVLTPSSPDVLPEARREAQDLRRRYRNVEVHDGLSGGPAALEAAFAGADVVHIAAHARVSDDAPWDSGFLFAGSWPREPASPPSRSGILLPEDVAQVAAVFQSEPEVRAWQIAEMHVPARLAVLAGCETAGGHETSGEGVLGLTAAFMSAGVPVVLSTAWPVDDRATRLVMEAFYDELAAGRTVSAALRNAQGRVRDRARFSHPFYWAGFAVHGDGSRTVPVERSRGGPSWVVLAVVAVAGLGVGISLGVLARKRNAQA